MKKHCKSQTIEQIKTYKREGLIRQIMRRILVFDLFLFLYGFVSFFDCSMNYSCVSDFSNGKFMCFFTSLFYSYLFCLFNIFGLSVSSFTSSSGKTEGKRRGNAPNVFTQKVAVAGPF